MKIVLEDENCRIRGACLEVYLRIDYKRIVI